MAEKIRLEVVTPEGIVVQENVDIVVAPGVLGQFGALVNHIPFLTSLGIGEMYYRMGSDTHYLALTGGYAEVLPHQVTILVEAAEHARDIDVDRARRAKERAEQRLRQVKTEEIDYHRAEAALKRAVARLKVAEKIAVNQ
jgi:F-type H+-transporting ATPase subunit epsilon